MSNGTPQATTPQQWGESLSGPPVLHSVLACATPMLVRRWCGISPDMEHPPLDQHFVSLHLGGAKRLTRRGEGQPTIAEVTPGAFSVVPAGSAFSWRTEGPVDFAHFYLEPASVARTVIATFDRDPRDVSVCEALGTRDLLVEALLHSILSEAALVGGGERRYLQELQQLLLHQLLRGHSTLAASTTRARYTLAPHRLRRALDFIQSNLHADIGLNDIAAAAGLSAFHFGRSFRQETGASPYAYLLQQRVTYAQRLLTDQKLSLAEVAQLCGFGSHSQFSRTFKRGTGVSPNSYRSLH